MDRIPLADRLDSWKEIAAYLRKGVRTVQRWEQTEGLPVRRLGQARQGSVFAYRSELDTWWHAKGRIPLQFGAPAEERPRWPYGVAACAVAAVLVAWVLLAVPEGRSYRPIPLTAEHGWEAYPTFSPDGRQVAYMWTQPGERSHIYLKEVGSDSQHRLTAGTEPDGYPAWSPNGRWIAFIRSSPARGWIVMCISPNGGEETAIALLTLPSVLAWSADNRWLVAVDGLNKQRSIVAISLADGSKHQLTEPFEFGAGGFGLSPDGSRLIFSLTGPSGHAVNELPLGPGLQPAGMPRPITDRLWISSMQVSADGKQILYIDDFREDGSLMRLRLSPGARPETLYTAIGRLGSPAISRDGHRIAFAASPIPHEEIWRVSLLNPTEPAAPLISSTHADMNPQYSPDGRLVAFHSTRTGASEIWIAGPDGANSRRLTYTNARTTATPRWSPDGKWIAFESNQTGQSQVYLVSSRGGTARQLTNDQATNAIPRWSRDGRNIYFCSDRTGRFEIWRVPVSGGRAEQITTDGGFAAVESPDGQWLYYSQTRNYGPVFRRLLAGSKPEEVIPRLRGIFFTVTHEGVYYESEDSIWFWDAASRARRRVLTPTNLMGIGLDVSPDGRTLLFTQMNHAAAETDLYLIDGVH